MTLLSECRRWNKEGKYRTVIQTLEGRTKRSPEQDVELAWAYINDADPARTPEQRDQVYKALDLLEAYQYEDKFRYGYMWNLAMGCAWYVLQREGDALPYLWEAEDAAPRDASLERIIENCRERLSRPNFEANFLQRAEKCWKEFAAREEELYRLTDPQGDWVKIGEVRGWLHDMFSPAMEGVEFDVEFEGEIRVLRILTYGKKCAFLEAWQLASLAPAELSRRWRFIPGEQGCTFSEMVLDMFDQSALSVEDVDVWTSKSRDGKVNLYLYSEKVKELSATQRREAIDDLLFDTLGDIPYFLYGRDWTLLEIPRKTRHITLSKLPERLQKLGCDFNISVEEFLQQMEPYTSTPNPMAVLLRDDVYTGITRSGDLCREYADRVYNSSYELYLDGAAAGFFAVPLLEKESNACYASREIAQQKLESLLKLGRTIQERAGGHSAVVTGAALGICYGYIEMIAWDIDAVLETAMTVAREKQLECCYWQAFRADALVVEVYAKDYQSQTAEVPAAGAAAGGEEAAVPFDPQNPDSFYEQNLRWIRSGQRARSIAVLESVPETVRDLKFRCFLASVLIQDALDRPAEEPESGTAAAAEPQASQESRTAGVVQKVNLGPDEEPEQTGVLNSAIYERQLVRKIQDYLDQNPSGRQSREGTQGAMQLPWEPEDEKLLNWEDEDGDAGAEDEQLLHSKLREDQLAVFQRVYDMLMEVHTAGEQDADWNRIMGMVSLHLNRDNCGLGYALRYAELLAQEQENRDLMLRGIHMMPDQKKLYTGSQELELYEPEELDAVRDHIEKYWGPVANMYREVASHGVRVDICEVEPTQSRPYYVLITTGMGGHPMQVPKNMRQWKLNRAELAIALPPYWQVDELSLRNSVWSWPIRLLVHLARLPVVTDSWLGSGHMVDNDKFFDRSTGLSCAILLPPQGVAQEAGECLLPSGEEVNFYQVVPLYREEMQYISEKGVDALLQRMKDISFVVSPNRPDATKRRRRKGS